MTISDIRAIASNPSKEPMRTAAEWRSLLLTVLAALDAEVIYSQQLRARLNMMPIASAAANYDSISQL